MKKAKKVHRPDGKNVLEKYLESKEHEKAIKEFYRKLYFNKKFRNGFRKSLRRMQSSSLKAFEAIPHGTKEIQELKSKTLYEKFVDLAGDFFIICDQADKIQEERKIINKKFIHYKAIRGKKHIFLCSFYRPFEKKNKSNYLIMDDLCRKKSKCLHVRKGIKPKGYIEVDRGKYHYKDRSFERLTYIFVGENTVRVKVTTRGKKKDVLWAKLV